MTTFDLEAHYRDALPALLAGRLTAPDAARVRAHAAACADCRAELELGERVHAHFAREWRVVAPLLEPARVDAGFERLWSRIAAAKPAQPKRVTPMRRWSTGVTALAATVLLGLGASWYRGAATAQFNTHADAPAAAARLCTARVTVTPGTLDAEARRALEGAGARAAAGPDATQTYTVGVDARALERIRALAIVQGVDAKGC